MPQEWLTLVEPILSVGEGGTGLEPLPEPMRAGAPASSYGPASPPPLAVQP